MALVVKNPSANSGDIREVGSISGSGRSPGTGHNNPLQYSCLENPMDRGAWQATDHGDRKRVRHDWSDLACMHACCLTQCSLFCFLKFPKLKNKAIRCLASLEKSKDLTVVGLHSHAPVLGWRNSSWCSLFLVHMFFPVYYALHLVIFPLASLILITCLGPVFTTADLTKPWALTIKRG